jgi:hypothetical protein
MNVRLDWADDASCRNSKNDFYSTLVTQDMYDTCYECPVLKQCRNHALQYERHGFWAAMTEGQRQRERKRLNISTPPALLFEPVEGVSASRRNVIIRSTSALETMALADIPHGTYKGYRMETNAKIPPCDACKTANKLFMREYRKKQKEKEVVND